MAPPIVKGPIPGNGFSFWQFFIAKWNSEENDGELIDDASRHEGDKIKSKAVYEEGMYRAFLACCHSLKVEGKLLDRKSVV